ncbi:inosine-uridine preferring nucleoside hydrolase-like [Ptychodera flava]|uniref:inosine-uridine preferring nucleoside hydrolase-like n=1 Tax=Ptychodera flava TaxID=63121 RepID=UPI00396A123E
MSKKTKVIIDCDAGVDDAQAIMMALAYPHIEVLGITCVAGNVSVHQVTLNVLRILKACGKLGKIPVYKGAESSLVSRKINLATHFHGDDGLGDNPDDNAPDASHLSSKSAVLALIEEVNAHPGEVSVVAIGPLTNLALAARLDPTFTHNVKEVSLMGGNIAGRGNVTATAEFNFYVDAEAAHVVLNDFHCPVYITSWETTCNFPLKQEWFLKWLEKSTEKGRFMKRINKTAMEYYTSERGQKECGTQDYVTCDPIAMALVINKKFIQETKKHHVTVELGGEITRGLMVVDWSDRFDKSKEVNTFLLTKFDQDMLTDMMELSLA